ncbi:uncharacterized protein [Macrobrachium rosenbergii]|uniref:uncharacterized protein n=1 Tax=Macrobrachium rosenbergii TaxID=79674 RepID=UPI0034D7A6A0
MSHPFACIGLDHTGPIQVGGGIGYILLVTCTSSRAIYLDYCLTLDAATFILMFRRLVAMHGCPVVSTATITKPSSTASTFLQEIFDECETQQFLHERRIKWHFETPRSPWKEGFFECLIGVVKHTLEVSFRRKFPTRSRSTR